MRQWGLYLAALALQGAESGYVDPAACGKCHAKIAGTYTETGMGRSFSSIASARKLEDWDRSNSYYHAASNRHYRMFRADGKYFLSRRQMDPKEGVVNVVEKEIAYAVGSGNHSRSYLARGAGGKLMELPISWYSEKGGYWAMSPGYDRPDHSDFRREVSDTCLFCHNGYPSSANGGLAQGIDCQRCHGPGQAHVANTGGIVNPRKLSFDRQMDVCLQCHLETASQEIPNFIRRYDRTPFSYRPGERLGDFAFFFDKQPNENFEVNHSAYGLRQSLCFLRSKGALTCTTCHNPHHIPRDETAKAHYAEVCRTCHSTRHAAEATNCTGCHMPKRRTTDAVHVVMTDHRIVRRLPPGDLLAPIPEKHERYTGEIAPYYPAGSHTSENRLYLALAQVKDFTNVTLGIPLLEKAISETGHAEAEFYFHLGQAYWSAGRLDDAIRVYRQAVERKPGYESALSALGDSLLRRGDVDGAIALLEPASKKFPRSPGILNALAVAYGQKKRMGDAYSVLSQAIEADSGIPLSWLNFGVCLEQKGEWSRAESSYRNAIRLQPDFDRAARYLKKLQQAIVE